MLTVKEKVLCNNKTETELTEQEISDIKLLAEIISTLLLNNPDT
jgi:hypothetical protein